MTAFRMSAPPAPFHVDLDMFDAWLAERTGDLDDDTPAPGSQPHSASPGSLLCIPLL